MSGVDFIEEIRIAQYWRKQLGELAYVNYNPDDLRRWYIALETRGPEDIRSYLIERTGRHPMGEVTGIVPVPPHPPAPIIQLWLESYNTVRTRPFWLAGVAFLVVSYYGATNLAGCQAIRTTTPLQRSPPATNAMGSGGAPVPQQAASTLPASLTPPASSASPPTGSSATRGGNGNGPH